MVLECVVERGEELEPSLDSGVMVSHFACAFQSLVVGDSLQVTIKTNLLAEHKRQAPN